MRYPFQHEWTSYNAAHSAFDRMYKKMGLSWCQKNHLKKLGRDYLSKMLGKGGMQEITSLSKHGSAKEYRYFTELSATALMVLAGFNKNDDYYFIPRSYLDFGIHTLDEITTLLFPYWPEWCDQSSSELGDNGETARNFLHATIPFASTVIGQDSIYWIQRYPTHSWSLFLLETFPLDYESWAAEARQRCRIMKR